VSAPRLTCVATLLACALAPATPALAEEAATATDDAPSAVELCTPSDALCCIPLHLHLATDEGSAAADETWIEAQVATANSQFGALGVAFFVADRSELTSEYWTVDDRDEHDLLGRSDFSKGGVHWYVVASLANVDEAGEIYGVHWRDRDKRSRHWVIVSAIAWRTTLAHELGHFFGLAHSDVLESLMNTKSGLPDRHFTEGELTKLGTKLDAMRDDKRIRCAE